MKKAFSLIFCVFYFQYLAAQVAPHTYWIQFTDKAHNTFNINRPLDFLSQRSIDRRISQGIGISESDLPVTKAYLDSIRRIGGKILFTSKWQNAATVFAPDSTFLAKVAKISIVKSGFKVYKTGIQVHSMQQQTILSAQESFGPCDYGASYDQIHIHNGEYLHNSGFKGQGLLIGVLDAGFNNVDKMQAFKNLRDRKGIIGIHDFIAGNDSVYIQDVHGMLVLSVICGNLPGKLIGTAPEADFLLLRTENANSENEVEEASWAAGMEMADSAGVDVFNSSLGYTQFDDPKMNHSYTDMDGHTTICSREASLAASKGMILVNSAGNLGTRAWHYVSAPADAENILTVGAIGRDRKLAGYTSRGPTYDGRIKPDVTAIGFQTICASTVDGEVQPVNGTSLSSPVIAGLVACLWQEFPDKTSFEIMDAVKKSSNRYINPDDSFGYGIPDFALARQFLRSFNNSVDYIGDVYPNPFQGNFYFSFYTTEPQVVEVYMMDILGRVVMSQNVQSSSKNFTQIYFKNVPKAQGLYFVGIKTRNNNLFVKMIKE